MNQLFYGRNLAVLRESIEHENIDLMNLDPPFNSNALYNVLFKAPSGEQPQAQPGRVFQDALPNSANNLCRTANVQKSLTPAAARPRTKIPISKC
jgi:hypothetical protein